MTVQRDLVRVGIIGAGASGLAQLKQLIDAFNRKEVREKRKLEVLVFEKNAEVGGVWLANEDKPKAHLIAKMRPAPSGSRVTHQEKGTLEEGPEQIHVYPPENEDPSPMYRGLRTNLPHDLMAFRDLPMPSDLPTFPSRAEIQDYLESYARRFDLYTHIQFNTAVRRLYYTPSSSGIGRRRWTIEYAGPAGAGKEEVDYVCCANGHYADGWIPAVSGLGSFNGQILHSRFFRSASDYAGQRVLVVGSFASGGDISRLLAAYNIGMYTSDSADQARDGRPSSSIVPPERRIDVHISCSAPSQYSVNPTDESTPWGKYVTYHPLISHISNGFPTPPSSASASPNGSRIAVKTDDRNHSVQTSTVHFEDGSILCDINTIIFATGYNFSMPFAKPSDEPWATTPLFTGRIRDGERAGGDEWEEGGVKGMGVKGLDELMLFMQGDRSICFPVMQYQVVPFPLAEVQTRLSSLLWAGLLPSMPERPVLPSNPSNPYSTPPSSPPPRPKDASAPIASHKVGDAEGVGAGVVAASTSDDKAKGQRKVMQTRQKLVFSAPYEWTYAEYLMSLMEEANIDQAGQEGATEPYWRRVEDFRRSRRADTGLRKRTLGY